MDLAEIVETIFGFAMLFFLLFLTIAVLGALATSSKKPRRRRSKNRRFSGRTFYTPREFSYVNNSNSNQFLVYFVENPELKALKLGVGTAGRVFQFLESRVEPHEAAENKGWKVLKVAKFSNGDLDFELGKNYAYEAEKRAHFYWRKVLELPIHLSDVDVGYSEIREYGQTKWRLTKGYTETAELGLVCEQSTWSYVLKSPGFIEEIGDFNDHPRQLNLIKPEHLMVDVPPGYFDLGDKKVTHFRERVTKSPEERFWEKVRKDSNNCWIWEAAVVNRVYEYGVFNFDGKNQMAHKISWKLIKGSMNEDVILEKTCETKRCVNPEHWTTSQRLKSRGGITRVSEFTCLTEGCENPSKTVTKPGRCEKCKQKAKRERRKLREKDRLI